LTAVYRVILWPSIILLESIYSSRIKVISAPVSFTNRISRPFTYGIREAIVL
jgi:hypothetical protein